MLFGLLIIVFLLFEPRGLAARVDAAQGLRGQFVAVSFLNERGTNLRPALHAIMRWSGRDCGP